jgi:hypothetical protein
MVRYLIAGVVVTVVSARADLAIPPAAAPRDAAATDDEQHGTIFPIQLDLELGATVGSSSVTNNLYFSAVFALTLHQLGSGPWNLYAGVGFANDTILYWKREKRQAPEAIDNLHNPGIEARIGFAYGTKFGGPRLTLKVTPQWAYGVEMDLPTSDRSFGFRASVGAAYPGWLIAMIDTDGENEGLGVLGVICAVLIPSEVEYVFQIVPGDTRHGFMFGWSL